MSKKILILGSAVIDVIIDIDRLPKAGEDIPGIQKEVTVGGCAFNVSKILDELHVAHDLCVPVGKGLYADKIRAALQASHHNVMIEDKRCDNGYCLSLVEADGERTFITMDGIETMWLDAWLQGIDAYKYDYIYASGYGFQDSNSSGDVIMNFLRRKNADCRLVLDPGPRLLGKRFQDELLSMGMILELNQTEAKALSGKDDAETAAKALHAVTKQPVIVTLNSRGTFCVDKDGAFLVPTTPVKAIDTIGAGDSHTAGFLAALSEGKSLKEACAEANRVAAIVVQHVGCSLS